MAVENEVGRVTEITAGTARSIGALAELSKESLERMVVLVATVDQLHQTTKTGVAANEQTAHSLIGLARWLIGLTVMLTS